MASTLVAIAPLVSLFVAGDSLLVKTGDGYKDGIVSVAHKGPKEVTLKAVKAEGKAIADALKDKLPGAEISVDGDTVTITGRSDTEVLDEVAAVQMEVAPQFAMDMPEAGGSIRVGKAMEIPQDATPSDDAERFKARVIGVNKGKYPEVTIKLKVTSGPQAAALTKKFKKISYITARVALSQRNGQLDLSHPLTQSNLSASYLKAGDDVLVHVSEIKGASAPDNLLIDFIERR